jgi:hypothetical protein
MRLQRLLLCLIALCLTASAFAQQTGSISGKVTATDGSALPGVTVEARSNVLPQPRVTTTDSNGDYRLPALQPGAYTLQFTLAGMQTGNRKADVQLGENTVADVKLGMAGLSESVTVTAETTMVDKQSTAIQSGLSGQQIQALPVGQEYRDLQKLIPGVMFTQDETRGPSAGGSGQDNVYQFDGVNVTLPLFGTLSAEPANHDVDQVTVIKGGAKAIDFDRSGGFTIDSVSKSGTNRFSGELGFQTLRHSFSATPAVVTSSKFDEDRNWSTANLGGPILADRLFFYGSYYRPTRTRNNRANLYGPLPKYSNTRNEEFGKLTATPISSILLNGSYRTSKKAAESNLFLSNQAATSGTTDKAGLKIAIGEGSWIINNKSYATFKLNDFANRTSSVPTNIAASQFANAIGTKLDINNLPALGAFIVPCPTVTSGAVRCSLGSATNTPSNNFIAPYVAKYGYQSGGTSVGGGTIGVNSQFDRDDFFRKAGQVGYNLTLGSAITHDFHAGYQRYTDSEDLARSSNGWGAITIPGGSVSCLASICGTAQPIFFQAAVQQQSLNVPPIHSEYQSQNVEFNDSIRSGNWSFNVGLLDSHDTLFGQGLKKADNVAGFVTSPGTKYQMYDIPWSKMLQPRLGATWAYNGVDTVYGAFDIYHPAATSLPRAASWDRNLRQTVNLYFDQNASLIGVDPVKSSSGKLFVQGISPRTVKEYLVGTAQQINTGWSARLYGRYRNTTNFWEDTPNTARIDCGASAVNLAKDPSKCNPPASVPRVPYISDLTARLAAIGSGSTYVIANLDGAFTKYYEATMESEWRSAANFVRGSYTWSHYYGNFDQDNTTAAGAGNGAGNDQNSFIGSSNIADAPGRQLWDNKYGNLHGDRRHMFKLYGTHMLPWRASAGAFFVFQSGQPWEATDYHFYQPLTGSSTTDTIRFAEHAGTRRTPSHHQLDLNYTQNFPVRGMNLQFSADMFNVYNKRTGYNYQPSLNSSLFNTPQNAWDPRRFQLAVRAQF